MYRRRSRVSRVVCRKHGGSCGFGVIVPDQGADMGYAAISISGSGAEQVEVARRQVG
jgi:hypothetical protein